MSLRSITSRLPRPVLLRGLQPSFFFSPLSAGCFGISNSSPTWTEKAGQDIAAVEPHRGRQPGEVVRRRVDVHDPAPRPNVPDQADPLLEIFLELFRHLFGGIAPADDLHGQVGNEEGNRLFGNFTPGTRSHEMNDTSGIRRG